MKNHKIIFISCLAATLITSCKKDYLDRKPLSDVTVDNAIYSDESAIKVVNGAYGLLRQQKLYGNSYLKLIETPSDDFTPNESLGDYPLLNTFGYSSTSGDIQGFWLGCYDGVQRCNFGLQSIQNATQVSPEVKKYAIGQFYFLRAYYYWLLTTVYGDVPIYTEVPKTYEEIARMQSSRNEVYAQIERDLSAAISNLPEKWSGGNLGRVTTYSALAMLGKAYLYQQKWSLAKEAFAKVIISGRYKFNSLGYQANFNMNSENGEESLFEIQNYSGVASGVGIFFSDGGVSGVNNYRDNILGVKNLIGTANFGELIATRNLFNEFEPNDPRLRATLWVQNCDVDTVVRGKNYCICKDKIYLGTSLTNFTEGTNFLVPGYDKATLGEYFWVRKGIAGATQVGIQNDYGSNIPVIRYSDVLLMYAEASAESGDLNDAISKLNLVRDRAKLPLFPYTTQFGGHMMKNFLTRTNVTLKWMLASGINVSYQSNLDDFRKAIVHERRVELAAEYHRLNDLIRWSFIPGHPGNAIDVFKNKKNDPIERTSPTDYVNFGSLSRLFPKPQVEVDKGGGTLMQNPGY